MNLTNLAIKAKASQRKLWALTGQQRCQALHRLGETIMAHSKQIIAANDKDVHNGQLAGLSSALIDRLRLTETRIAAMAKGVQEIATQPEVIGTEVSSYQREDGLVIRRERIPIGLIGMIFESRPNVVIDCAALAIKSGNAMILKGGKEAYYSNQRLEQVIQEAFSGIIPDHCITVLDSANRSLVDELISLKGLVDLVIPRGGEALINHVYDHAKVPVIAHFKGLCHIYIDVSAKLEQAKKIVLNAKVQRPGVCNAMETLLLHQDLPEAFLLDLLASLAEKGVELRLCDDLHQAFGQYKRASKIDWDTEYLDLTLSIKSVASVDEAIEHISLHGSHHTEAILAENSDVIHKFRQGVDCSLIAVNASTRFNDGSQLGLGAEIGISTTKIHAYGPMGAAEMTTTRFVIEGDGHIRT